MIIPGLVSATLRQLSPAAIVGEVSAANLQGIEWSGDIHVPRGDWSRAREVRALSHDAGVAIVAYGSYFRLGENETVQPWIETAVALGAPTMRIWAGTRGSADASPLRDELVRELHAVCACAEEAGMTLSLEFHEGTYTDTLASTLWLVRAVNHPALQTYWQILQGAHEDSALLAEMTGLQEALSHVHVFSRHPDKNVWRPLADCSARWQLLLGTLARLPGRHAALIEFVADGRLEAFRQDAAALKLWCDQSVSSAFTR